MVTFDDYGLQLMKTQCYIQSNKTGIYALGTCFGLLLCKLVRTKRKTQDTDGLCFWADLGRRTDGQTH